MNAKKLAFGGITAAAALSLGTLAGPVSAQPTQEGLVNVNVTDVAVQVPVSVAANVCDVTVAALVSELNEGPTTCESDAVSGGEVSFVDGNGGPARQSGLVNLNIDDLAVQVPVSVAANVCDVTVGVLVDQLNEGPAECEADALSNARVRSLVRGNQ